MPAGDSPSKSPPDASAERGSKGDDQPYTVVWNDAVDLRQLAGAVVICVGIGLPAFLAARAFFTANLSAPALSGGYALLVGLLACVAAAAICARLFAPKRTFGTSGGTDQAAALAELAAMGGTPEAFDELPAGVQTEMTELGLAPRRGVVTPASGDPAGAAHTESRT